jgi:hypothetical protein
MFSFAELLATMVLIIKKNDTKTLKQQMNEALLQNKHVSVKHSWKKFFGKLKFHDNPVAYQRKLRDE